LKFSPPAAGELFRSPVPLRIPVHFRLARPPDVAELHAACFRGEPSGHFAVRFDSSLRLQKAGRLLHVVAIDGPSGRPVASGQVIGYTDTVAEIADLVVAGEMRGQGLGAALVRVLAALAADAGAEQLELAVRPDNERALALYRRLGFRASRLLRYPSGERAILMTRAPWPTEGEEEEGGVNST
jgi:ribosomal protein S18 acetylase RimI-like enzyme